MDPAASFAMPTSKADTTFDLSEIDFDYVERLQKKDVLKLKKIIVALEQEGDYPDLQRACREKLKQLDPKSVPPSFAAATSEEAKDAVADLLSWASSAKEKDAQLLRSKAGSGAGSKSKSAANDKSLPTIRGHTDSAFEEDPAAATGAKKDAMNLGPELNPSKLSSVELSAAAVLEKEKGNECFRAKEYNEAIKFYTRSLHLVANDSTTLNNRALAFLKSKNLDAALNDVSLVLQQEPSNFKALWRRGQVWEGKLFLERALDDFNAAQTAWQKSAEGQKAAVKENADIVKSIRKVQQQLLEQEPNHPYVQHLKKQKDEAAAATEAATTKKNKEQEESKEQKEDEGRSAAKTAATTAANAEAVSKAFKRMAIAEVDDDDEEDEEEDEQHEEAEEKSPTPPAAAAPAPAPASAAPESKPMKRVAIQEVEEDDEEEETPKAKPGPAAAAPAPQPVKKEVKKPAPTFHSKSGGVTIELVSDEEEEEEAQKVKERVQKIKEQEEKKKAAAAASPAKAAAASSSAAAPAPAFVMPATPPSSGVAFEKDWGYLSKQGSLDQQAEYLRGIGSQQYSKLFPRGKEMSSGSFSGVLSVLAQKLLPARSALETLEALSTMDRFALTLAMVDSKTKKAVRGALEQVSSDADKELATKLLSKY